MDTGSRYNSDSFEEQSQRIESLDGQQLRTLEGKRRFIEAYRNTCGNVQRACLLAGIKSRKTFYNWRDSDPDFKQALDSALVIQQDYINDLLMMKILKGDPASVRWFLKHKHPDYKQKRSSIPPQKQADPWKKWDKMPWPEDKKEKSV